MRKSTVGETGVWLAVGVFAAWFVVVTCPGLHVLYLTALAIALMAIPAAGLVALGLTVWDTVRDWWKA